jgi:hypothetical protein
MSRSYNYPGDVPAPYVSAPVRSTASVVAICCALASFYFSSRHTQSLAFILAFVAIGAGLLGGIKALSPRVSGGILSIIAVLMGVIGLVVALLSFVL